VVFQTGNGTYTIFQGMPYQRGAGIGALFKSLIRFLIPIGKDLGAAIGRQGLESGTKALTSILEGKDIKETLRNEGKAGLKNLLERAALKMENANAQEGQGKTAMVNGKPKKCINKRKKVRRIFSRIEPPLFPATPTSFPRKRITNSKFPRLPKKLRFDALGPY
jgi:hypothetical protein